MEAALFAEKRLTLRVLSATAGLLNKLCSHHSTKHCRACVQDGAVIDKVMIIKDRHGAGLYNCHKQSQPNVFKPTFHDVDQLPINPDRL